MALHNSTGATKAEKANQTFTDLSALSLDPDVIFGCSSHLVRRQAKFAEDSSVRKTSVSHGFGTRTRRLHSEEETQRGWRPPPEGSGNITVSETCHSERGNVNQILSQGYEVNIAEQGPDKDCGCPVFLDKFSVPEVPLRGQNVGETHCQRCAVSRHRLSGQAPQVPHARGRNMPDLQPASLAGLPVVTLFSSPVRATVGNGPAASTHRSSTVQSVHCQKGVWSILHQPCLGPTGEARRGRGVALGTPSADLTGPMQMVQGVALADTAHSGSSTTISFLSRAAQKLSLSSKRKKPHPHDRSAPPTDFSTTLHRAPPPMPPCLFRARSKVKENPGIGKVKVMVRVCPSKDPRDAPESATFLKADPRKRQLTLCDPFERAPPKTFGFDALFSQDASQAEVCAGTVADVLQSVVNGADGCVFSFGHVGLGKTYTMMGDDGSAHSLGVAPSAISWLYRLVEEHREQTGARVMLRVSAVEISGREETLRDLLGGASGNGPAPYLREDPICGSELCNQREVGASSPEQAASLLDEALAGRSSSGDSEEDERRHSHMLFTLHLYQQHLDQGQAALSVGRSRLHLIDLGSCEPITREGGQTLTLRTLGNVILALTSGSKHVPYRDSKLTMLLRESLGNINCRTTMIAHISDSETNYVETLTTIQLASRVHRMRKKKSKSASNSSGGDTPWDEGTRPADLRFCHPQTINLAPPALHCSDRHSSSNRTRACDAVIYVGLGGAAICERELGVNEAPPASVPIIPSLNRKWVRDGRPSDGDHFKCNTFAELQDWLDCVGGSEGGRGTGGGSAKPTMQVLLSTHIATPSTEPKDPPKRLPQNMPVTHSASSTCSMSETDRYKWPDLTLDSFGRMDDDREKALFSEQCTGAFHQSGSLNRRHLPKPKAKATSSQEVLSQRAPCIPERSSAYRAPPVGMSQQEDHWRAPVPGVYTPNWAPTKTKPLCPTPRGGSFDQDVLTTTVTLRRPVELNGEDELVFTLVEELSVEGLADNGVSSDVTGFRVDHPSPQALPAVSRRVAIVSSINDEFDAYTSQAGLSGLGIEKGRSKDTGPDRAILPGFPGMLCEASSFKRDTTSSINDGTSPASDKFLTRKFPPASKSIKANSSVYKTMKVSALNTFPHPQIPQAHSSLPRSKKPTSSVTQSSGSHKKQRSKGKPDDPWLRIDSSWDSRAAEVGSGGRLSRNGAKKPGGNSNSVPRPPKPQSHRSPQRLVDGCERSHDDRANAPCRAPMLRREATTLGTVPVIHGSTHGKQNQDSMLATGSLKFLHSGKKMSGTNGASPKSRGHSPSTPPVQRYNLDPKARNDLAASALKSSEAGVSMLEMEFDMRFKSYSSSHKTSSLKFDYSSAKTKSSLKARMPKGNAGQGYGSLERCDSLISVGSKPGLSRDNSDSSLGSRGRSGYSGSKPGSPVSTSPPPCSFPRTSSKLGQIQGSTSTAAVVSNGNQAHAVFSASHSSTVCAVAPVARNVILPPGSKAAPHSAITGMKQVTRAVNSRVSELASGGPSRHPRGLGEVETKGKLGDGEPLPPLPPSPYSKVTAPRKAVHCSSGHCSDNSSVLSGELPPAMGHTALFYHSGGSSGYESLIRDSEARGSISSTRDSRSESNVSSPSRYRAPRKRATGYQRRRMIPTPLPDTSPVGRKASTMGQWVDLLPLPGTLKEPFEIKVYEIDDATHLQQQRRGSTAEGLLYFNTRLKMLERRQQQIRDLQAKHENLNGELEDVKNRLMLDPQKWIGEFEVDPDLDKESQEYLEALAQVTRELEYCVNLCKSRVMMETCFDVEVASRAQGGLLEMQV